MLRTSLLLCVPAVLGIVVTDPPLATDYRYAYSIEDPATGDSKSQREERRGGVVSGAYSALGPDGTRRTVEYTADAARGFHAVLREQPAAELPPPRPPVEYTGSSRHHTPRLYSVVQKSPVPYAKQYHDVMLFTPADDIKPDRVGFKHGNYFDPAAK